MVSILVLILAILSYQIYNSSSNIVKEEVNKNLNMIKYFHKNKIDDFISELDRQVKIIGNESEIYSTVDMSNSIIENADNTANAKNVLSNVILGSYSFATGYKLHELVNKIEDVEFAYITLANGMTVIDSRIISVEDKKDIKDYLLKDLNKRDYKDIQLGQLNYVNKKPYLLYNGAIREENSDKIIGYVVLAFSPNLMYRTINLMPEDYMGKFTLINGDGVILRDKNKDFSGDIVKEDWYIKQIKNGKKANTEILDSNYVLVEKIRDDIYLTVSIPLNEMFRSIDKLGENIMFISLISLIASFILSVFFINKQLKPLDKFLHSFNSMKNGDLGEDILLDSKYLKRSDEIGIMANAFNTTAQELRDLVAGIKEQSYQLADFSKLISSSIEEVVAGSQEQLAQVDETSNNVRNLNGEITLIDNNIKQISKDADQVIESIKKGNNSINYSMLKINNVSSKTLEVATIVSNLGEFSEQIGRIIDLISNFSKRTNLLALNATIEAAKAGQEGKGFSVVADEIRNLAKQSSEATEKITSLIESIQDNVNNAVNVMETNKELVGDSVNAIEETNVVFEEIEQLSMSLSDFLKMIVDSLIEMTSESQSVEESINEISTISTQFTSNSEDIVITTKRLEDMSQKLTDAVDKFEI